MNENTKNKLKEEFNLFLETRCINHPDFFPDECCGVADWWLSKIDTLLKEQREEIMEKINEFSFCKRWELRDDKMYIDATLDDIINLIKE